jgi:uncharacterized membrane protein YbhN (UPF0104 family)
MNYKKILVVVLKLVVVVLLVWLVYSRLSKPEVREQLYLFLHQPFTPRLAGYLLIIFYLAYLNLLMEALKWRLLLKKLETLSWYNVFSSVMSGLSLASFTPGRIGEFGGRVLYLKSENRFKGVLVMGIGSFCQMMVTNILGGIGVCLFTWKMYYINDLLFRATVSMVSILVVLMFILLVNVRWFYFLIVKIPWLKSYKSKFVILLRYSQLDLVKVFSYSLLRYFIFSMQYYLLIKLFIPTIPYIQSMILISLIYMVQSIIPTFALADMGIRGLAATFFFGFLVGEEQLLSVTAAALGIWLINLIIPSFIGSYYVLKANVNYNRTNT